MRSTASHESYCIIGIIGSDGSGRRSVATVLHDGYGLDVIDMRLLLQAEIAAAWGIGPHHFLGDQRRRRQAALAIDRCANDEFVAQAIARRVITSAPRTPQDVERMWRDDYRAPQQPTYWPDLTEHVIQDALRQGRRRLAVVGLDDDASATVVRRLGGSLWLVQRDSADGSRPRKLLADVVIDNNGSMVRLASATMRAYLDHQHQ